MTNNQTNEVKNKLAQHYIPLLNEHGNSFRSLNWGSEKSQRHRFEILLAPFLDRMSEFSLLDVGCGLAHLYSHIKKEGLNIDYSGIDAVSEMIDSAKQQHPEIAPQLSVSSVLDIETKNFDVVVASGIFYVACSKERMLEEIDKLFSICTIGLAFNSLSSWSNEKEQNEFYADPISILDHCRKNFSTRCILRHDYMPHDFTIHLFRENING